jgi:hypothetical protein
LLQLTCASKADSARFKTFFHLVRMLPVFCSSDFIVALNRGPSSVWLRSSLGRETSSLIGMLLFVRVVACVGTNPSTFSGIGSKVGDLGATSHSRPSSAESLTRESIDCVEGTRRRGGTLRSRRGDGDDGLWLRAVSVCVSHASCSVKRYLL